MREDMFKVIVERPRHGSRCADVEVGRTRFRDGHRDADEPAAHESLKSRHRWHKSLNENLNPMQRWLEKQVGRPWDKVFSELCAGIDRRSTVQQHIHQHVDDFVARRVVRVDGVLCEARQWAGPTPLGNRWLQTLYVDPDTGILRRNDFRERTGRKLREQWRVARTTPPADRRDLDASRQLHRVDGVWYEVELAATPVTTDPRAQAYDVLRKCVVRTRDDTRNRTVGLGSDRERYGRDDVYACRKRQLSARELARHGLAND